MKTDRKNYTNIHDLIMDMPFDLKLYKKIFEKNSRTDMQITTDKEVKLILIQELVNINIRARNERESCLTLQELNK